MYSLVGRVSRMTTCFDRARFEELVHRNGLCVGAMPKVLLHQSFEFSQTSFGHRSNDFRQLEHVRIGKPVVHEQSVLPTFNERRLSERLQMLRGVRHRETDLRRQRINSPLALRQQFEHLETMRVGQRFPEPGELAVKRSLNSRW